MNRHTRQSAEKVAESAPIETALTAWPKFGQGFCVQRMEYLLEGLPPHAAWDTIKITGSNGKGSTAAFLDAIFDALGIDHGCFTSPHLRRFHERITRNNAPIDDTHLAAALAWARARTDAHLARSPEDHYGAFEVFTALAAHYWTGAGVAHAVVEAGIGGRYDPTRLLPGSWVGLTSLDLEHTALLGPSLEAIAFDKMDLCPHGGTLICNPLEPALRPRLEAYARLRGIHLVWADAAGRITDCRYTGGRARFDLETTRFRFPDLSLALAGAHQVDNARLAVLLAVGYLDAHDLLPEASQLEAAVRAGCARATLPGRAEVVTGDPLVVIDVGHTPRAVAAFCDTLPMLVGDREVLLVTGVSEGKDLIGMVAALAPTAREIITTRAHHRGLAADQVTAAVRALVPHTPCTQIATPEQAMPRALARARETGMAVVVAGGMFLAVECRVVLEGGDPRALRLF